MTSLHYSKLIQTDGKQDKTTQDTARQYKARHGTRQDKARQETRQDKKRDKTRQDKKREVKFWLWCNIKNIIVTSNTTKKEEMKK